jgi:Rieske Fe-S protein
MRNFKRVSGKVEIIKRLPSSVNGNPRYLISIGGIECKTPVDSTHGYGITNYRDQFVYATICTHYGVTVLDTLWIEPQPVQLELF